MLDSIKSCSRGVYAGIQCGISPKLDEQEHMCSQRWHTLSAHGFKQCEPLQMMSLWKSDDSVFRRADEPSSWRSMLQHEALCTVITIAKFKGNWWYLLQCMHITQMWQFYYLATHFHMLAFLWNLSVTPAAVLVRPSWSHDAVLPQKCVDYAWSHSTSVKV